jgi:hypothetical protein
MAPMSYVAPMVTAGNLVGLQLAAKQKGKREAFITLTQAHDLLKQQIKFSEDQAQFLDNVVCLMEYDNDDRKNGLHAKLQNRARSE